MPTIPTPRTPLPPSNFRSIVADGFVAMRIVLVIVASTLVATFADIFVEAAIACGAFGPGYVDRSHASIVPAAALASASLVFIAAWLRAERRYDARWLRLAARDGQRQSAALAIAAVTLTALGISFVMERSEQLLGGGAPFGGLPLLSGAGLVVAAAFAIAATIAVCGLGAALRAIGDACDVVARAARTCVIFFVGSPHLFASSERARRAPALRFVPVAVRASGRRGDRAPPLRSPRRP